MVKKMLAAATAFGATALSASVAFAEEQTIAIDPKKAGFKIESIGTLIQSLLTITLGIVGLLVFVFLIWGGVEWVTAGGDKSKTESARQKITNAIIGLAIVAAAFAISKVLSTFLGINVGTDIKLPSAY